MRSTKAHAPNSRRPAGAPLARCPRAQPSTTNRPTGLTLTVQSRADTVPLFHHPSTEGAKARPMTAVEASEKRISWCVGARERACREERGRRVERARASGRAVERGRTDEAE